MLGLMGKKKKKKKRSQEDQGDEKTEKGKKRLKAGVLRLQIDFQDLELPSNCKLKIPDKEKLQTFYIEIRPDSGLWLGGTYTFKFIVPDDYPHKAPKVTLEERIYHPNIDENGAVCLNLLKADWKPILTVQQILHGLMFLFLEPNPDDPLNHEAAKLMREDKARFKRKVTESVSANKRLKGGRY